METTTAAANAGVPRQRVDFAYDDKGRRVCKKVSTSADGTTWQWASETRFLYDGWNLIAEYGGVQSAGEVLFYLQASHIWGLDLSGTLQGAGGVGGLLATALSDDGFLSSQSYFPAFDGNGNITAWLNQSGTLIGRTDYSPFGQLIAQYKFTQPGDDTLSRLPFGFSTKYTDKETGLLYYGYRYYDPVTGRWPSRDPIGEKGGLNLYSVLSNNCLSRFDLLGRDAAPQAPNSFKVKRAGAEEIKKVADAMKALCAQSKCRDRCKCTKEDCEKDAQEIAELYIDAFNATVKDVPNNGHAHGGRLCYGWAEAMLRAVSKAKGKCWKANWVGNATSGKDKTGQPATFRNHNYVFVSLGAVLERANGGKQSISPVKDCGVALDPWEDVTAEAYPPQGSHDWNYYQQNGKAAVWVDGKILSMDVSNFTDS